MSTVAPLFGRPEEYRPEWDPGYVVTWKRIDGARIDQERERRMWGKLFLARRARVGSTTLTQVIAGRPFRGGDRAAQTGVRVDAIYRIARALGLELTDVVKPV